MARLNLAILTPLALAAFLWTAAPAPAQHRGGGGGFRGGGGGGFRGAPVGGFRGVPGGGVRGVPGGVSGVRVVSGARVVSGVSGVSGVRVVSSPRVVFSSPRVVFFAGSGQRYYAGARGYGYPLVLGIGVGAGYGADSAELYLDDYGSAGATRNSYYTPPSLSDNTAAVHVIIPADAELWFNGTATNLRGGERDFSTPELIPGRSYTYEVRARWTQDGKTIEQTAEAEVLAGKTTTIDFSGVVPAPKDR